MKTRTVQRHPVPTPDVNCRRLCSGSYRLKKGGWQWPGSISVNPGNTLWFWLQLSWENMFLFSISCVFQKQKRYLLGFLPKEEIGSFLNALGRSGSFNNQKILMWDFNIFKPSQNICSTLIVSVTVLLLQQTADLVDIKKPSLIYAVNVVLLRSRSYLQDHNFPHRHYF